MINFMTKKEYTNTNAETLMEAGYDNQYWMTFKQAAEMGYKVNKGEKGTQLVRVIEKEEIDKETKKKEKKKILKKFYVFNMEQMTKLAEAA